MDDLLEFADATSVAAAAGTALIGDVIDLGSAGENPGNGQPLYVLIRPSTEIITGGAAGTLTFKVASDAQAAIATDGTATEHVVTTAFVTDGTDANDAELKVGGTILQIALPISGTYERYLGILAVTATTTTTAGAVDAFLSYDPNEWRSYPDATN
jgi:hypothetical protein